MHDDPFRPLPKHSFLEMIAKKEYLPDPSPSRRRKRPIECFYSYAHADEELRKELEKHLSILKRQEVITNWHDRKIEPGKEWNREIDEHLQTADIILLLISIDFLASDYCYDIEMKRAMERQEAKEARVIPVILRPVDWEKAPFAKLQALPRDAKAVTLWNNEDEAFSNIAAGIQKTVEQLSDGLDDSARLNKGRSRTNAETQDQIDA